MQLATKYIANNAVTDVQIRLTNAGWLRGRNAANSADIDMFQVDSSNQILAGAVLDMNSQNIINLADPSSAQQAATKNYVDLKALGMNAKVPAQAATTGPLPANTYANGTAGVGATLTGNSNGALPAIDGYSASVNDRILVWQEATAANNGIYVVTQLGDAGTPYILTRSTDANQSTYIDNAYLFILQGSTYTDAEFFETSLTPPVMGTDAINFIMFPTSSLMAGNGITISSGTVSVKLLASSGLGFSGSSLEALVQGAGTLNTTAFDGSGNIKALKASKSTFTLSSGNITNQYVDLSVVAHTGSVFVQPVGGMPQQEGQDYSLSYTGGSGGNTRVTFLNGLASGGGSALVAGDVLLVNCQTL